MYREHKKGQKGTVENLIFHSIHTMRLLQWTMAGDNSHWGYSRELNRGSPRCHSGQEDQKQTNTYIIFAR